MLHRTNRANRKDCFYFPESKCEIRNSNNLVISKGQYDHTFKYDDDNLDIFVFRDYSTRKVDIIVCQGEDKYKVINDTYKIKAVVDGKGEFSITTWTLNNFYTPSTYHYLHNPKWNGRTKHYILSPRELRQLKEFCVEFNVPRSGFNNRELSLKVKNAVLRTIPESFGDTDKI